METWEKILLVGLGVFLFVGLLSANLLVTADRTVLDAEFAKETADEEGIYDQFLEEFVRGIEGETPAETEAMPIDRPIEEVIQEALTEEYARTQGDANVDRVYEFLHGDRDELYLAIDVTPIKDHLGDEIDATFEEVDLAALGVPDGETIEQMAEDEDEFERQQAAFREEQKDRLQAETEPELTDEELDALFEEESDEIRDRLHEEAREEVAAAMGPDVPPDAAEPAEAIAIAHVDALLGEITFEAYDDRVEAETDELATVFAEHAHAELDREIPETMELTEGMDADEMQELETAQTAVSIVSILAIALPVFALVLAGLIAWIAPPSLAAIEVGAVAGFVGAIGVAGSQLLAGQLETIVAEEPVPPGMDDLILGIATGVFDTLTWQSLALLLFGIALLAVGIAIRRGMLFEDID